jgi:Holliday junction resolvase
VGKASRDKGKKGEREVANMFTNLGLKARRMAPMQAQKKAPEADVALEVEGFHVEVKRREKISIQQWMREVEAKAHPLEVPVCAFRSNGEPWRVCMPLEDFADLLKKATL